ncbi:type II toxin-antitoxin system RelE family toxin [Nautilia sp.]
MEIVFDEKAIKDLKKLPKNTIIKIKSKIELLKNFPETPNIKKLTNFHPPYRLRVNDYRVLFDIENNIITIYRVKHRKESYK